MIKNYEQAQDLIERANSIVILTHTRPDGDAVSSLLALGLSLSAHGKSVTAVLHDRIPPRFEFLPGVGRIETSLPGEKALLISLDCADPARISLAESERLGAVDINIDHHKTNTGFGRVNLVDPQAVSTTQVLYELISALELPLTMDVASNLMVGLVTDTIGFRTENMNAEAFHMAGSLLEMGVPLSHLYERALTLKSYPALKYWGLGLSKIHREDSIVWTRLLLEDRKAAGYMGKDDADLTNLLSAIDGVQVSIIFIEQENGRVKISFRSREGVDVSNLASQFGGGGHAPAAGAMVQGDIDEIIDQVLATTRATLLVNSERVT